MQAILALGSAVVHKHTNYSVQVKDFSSMRQKTKHINQDSTLRWNKMSTQRQDQHQNAGATEVQQLNPGGPNQRQSIKPQPT